MVCYLIQISAGFLAGMVAGLIMGIASDIAFRARFFRSSLFVIDGSFFMRTTGIKGGTKLVYIAGISIHLVTSGAFGAIYAFASQALGLPTFSILLTAVYVFFLWLSMLFIALPVSGQGVLGRKSGGSTWLEQLILHALFFAAYYGALRLVHWVLLMFIQTIE